MIIPIYNIIRSNVPEPALAEREILQQVKLCKHTPIRITFFTDIACNEGYIEQRERIEACCKELFGNKRPVVALVVQPPLECKLLAEVTYIDAACEVEYHDDYILLDGCQLYTAAIYSSLDKCIEEQSDDIFEHLNRILALQGFAINDIVRQWNYIEHITHISAQGQNYQQFNDSRSRFYNRTTWQNGYPAATGIGTGGGGVVVMVDAIKESCKLSRPIDNPLQLSAHAYSQQVLIEGKNPSLKTTPKFERARWVGDDSSCMIYISGTAAIRGEESQHDDIQHQAVVTMENIEELTSTKNQRHCGVPNASKHEYELLRVYIKQGESWQGVESYLKDNFACQNISFVEADICRAELLIEIEGIAKKNK